MKKYMVLILALSITSQSMLFGFHGTNSANTTVSHVERTKVNASTQPEAETLSLKNRVKRFMVKHKNILIAAATVIVVGGLATLSVKSDSNTPSVGDSDSDNSANKLISSISDSTERSLANEVHTIAKKAYLIEGKLISEGRNATGQVEQLLETLSKKYLKYYTIDNPSQVAAHHLYLSTQVSETLNKKQKEALARFVILVGHARGSAYDLDGIRTPSQNESIGVLNSWFRGIDTGVKSKQQVLSNVAGYQKVFGKSREEILRDLGLDVAEGGLVGKFNSPYELLEVIIKGYLEKLFIDRFARLRREIIDNFESDTYLYVHSYKTPRDHFWGQYERGHLKKRKQFWLNLWKRKSKTHFFRDEQFKDLWRKARDKELVTSEFFERIKNLMKVQFDICEYYRNNLENHESFKQRLIRAFNEVVRGEHGDFVIQRLVADLGIAKYRERNRIETSVRMPGGWFDHSGMLAEVVEQYSPSLLSKN